MLTAGRTAPACRILPTFEKMSDRPGIDVTESHSVPDESGDREAGLSAGNASQNTPESATLANPWIPLVPAIGGMFLGTVAGIAASTQAAELFGSTPDVYVIVIGMGMLGGLITGWVQGMSRLHK